MSAGTGDVSFDTEVVKLLLQVAWADDTVDPREKQAIFGLARSWAVPEAELAGLLEKMDQGHPLPQPNLKLLRTRPEDVLRAARAVVASDGTVAAEEAEMLEQIEGLLSGK
jgi:tellurite resistance protein